MPIDKEWIFLMWYTLTMEYSSAFKKKRNSAIFDNIVGP